MSMTNMVVDRRVPYETGTLVIFECGAIQLIRENGTNEFLRESEVEAIRDATHGDS